MDWLPSVRRRERRPGSRQRLLVPRLATISLLLGSVILGSFFLPQKDNNTSGDVSVIEKKSADSAEVKDDSYGDGDGDGEAKDCGGPAEMMCEDNISPSEKALWITLYTVGVSYVFIALAVVCDDFFVPSLEVITEELELTPDVAGATFMAAGSSAPELFTSIVGVFYQKSDVGIGTILGSAVFNILIIIGLTGVLAGQELELDWKPLFRDSSFYVVSILLLIAMFQDRVIDMFEAVSLIVCYVLYLVVMKFNPQLMAFLTRMTTSSSSAPTTTPPAPTDDTGSPTKPMVRRRRTISGTDQGPPSFRVVTHMVIAAKRMENLAGEQKEGDTTKTEDDDDDDGDILDFPDNWGEQLMYCVALPLLVGFKLTIPQCGKDEHRSKYPISFLASIAWIGGACFFMADWARSLGCMLNIPPEVMGLTLLAAGTSVPDALSSLFVAQDGEGDMAVSNAIGSNVFDILLGLGLPWVMSIHLTGPVAVCGEGIIKSSIILFMVLAVVVLTLMMNKWVLKPSVGWCFIFLYFIFVIFSLADNAYHLI